MCHVGFCFIHPPLRVGESTSPFYGGNTQDSDRLASLPEVKQLTSGRAWRGTLLCLTLKRTFLWWELGHASFGQKGRTNAKQLFVSGATASLIHMGEHVSSFIIFSGNESEIILHVAKQNKQANKNVYHSYQGPHSLKMWWLVWSVWRKISKSIRYQRTDHLKNPPGPKTTGPKELQSSTKRMSRDCPEWMRKIQSHLSIKTTEKKG